MIFIIFFIVLIITSLTLLIVKIVYKPPVYTTTPITTRKTSIPTTTTIITNTSNPPTTSFPDNTTTTYIPKIQNVCNNNGQLVNDICVCNKNTLGLPIYSTEPADKCKSPIMLDFVYELKSAEESKDPFVNNGNGPELSIDSTNPLIPPYLGVTVYPYSPNITIRNVSIDDNNTRFIEYPNKQVVSIPNPPIDTVFTMNSYLMLQSKVPGDQTFHCSFDVYEKNNYINKYSLTSENRFDINPIISNRTSSTNYFFRKIGNSSDGFMAHILYINENLI
jgi:hypothetical protein